MKRYSLLLAIASAPCLLAGQPETTTPPRLDSVPVTTAPTSPVQSPEVYVYDQKPMAGHQVLIAPEQAKALIERFKTNYAKLGNPRMVIYVNRDLVDEASGVRLSGRTEKIQSNTTEVKTEFKADPNAPAPQINNSPGIPPAANVTIVGDVSGRNPNRIPGSGNVNTRTEKKTEENTYKSTDRNSGTLADKQTVRDVERLFGRPLRIAGVTIADQRVATQLLSDRPIHALTTEGEQARKDREALGKIADVALEVLISSRQITVPGISGDQVYNVPDIQATAISLKDAKILGQATASDIIGKDRYAGNIARTFDVREIAEATALALMEDMLLSVE